MSDVEDVNTTLDYRKLAGDMFPWLTSGLLDIFAERWAETGDAQFALNAVRNTTEYSSVFPGIKRDDGSLRMTEGEYFAQVAGFTETLAEFGYDPAAYRKQFATLIEQEVDAAELFRATSEGFQRFVEPGGQRTPLADEFLNQFIQTGSTVTALERIRESDTYGSVFVNNRRADGTLRMDEPEYFAYKRGWQRTLASYGLDPRHFESRGRFAESVEREVSIQELDTRLQTIQQGVLSNIEQVREFYAGNYGIELTNEAILGMAVDPSVERDVLQRRVTASQIGGEAALQGFIRSVDRAELLARAGVDQGQARDIYSRAGQALAGINATTRRFFRGATDIEEFEDVFALGDAEGQQRINRALQSEKASFGLRSDVQRSREGFGLSGLRPQ